MKIKFHSFRHLFVVLAALSGLNSQLSTAFAQGTVFTYQGRLNNGTNPVTGFYDLRFHLYDSPSGGNILAGPVTNSAVPVTNGLFTVQVDFGAGVFTGSSNWLQIGVRTNATGAFSTLSPRNQVTPTPYAIFAETANAAGLSGTVPGGDLNLSGVSGSGLVNLNASQLTTGTISDARLAPDVALLDAPNQQFIGTNRFATGVGNGALRVQGSSGIDTSLFTGLGFQYYDSSGEGALMSSYNDGFSSLSFYTKQGGGFPIAKQVAIDRYGNVNIDLQGANNGFFNNGTTGGVGLAFGGGGEGIASKRTAGGNQYGLDFYTGNSNKMSITSSGFVGIGTQTAVNPADTQFELYSPTTNSYDGMWIATGAGGLPFYGYSEGGGVTAWSMVDGSDGNKWKLYDGGFWLTVTPSGNVGVGTTTPATKLEVNGGVRTDGGELYLEPSTSGVYANDGMVWGNGGLPGINAGSASPWIAGYLGGSLGALAPNTVCISWDAAGDAWVSNNLSTASLTVRGNYLVVNGGTPVYAYLGDDGSGSDVQIGSQRSGITAVAAYNTADGAYMHFYCSSITIEGGADLAEPFNITSKESEEVPQGSVVVIDDQNPGRLKVSDASYDTHVAGVVSGANGINPGIQMQQQGLLDGGKNVALTGRVYVQADTSNGAIKPGDLLTTSTIPGHAMKVTDHARAVGAILGKAMTGLSEGKGMVLVLVTLQ
jgi:hypothetical protein